MLGSSGRDGAVNTPTCRGIWKRPDGAEHADADDFTSPGAAAELCPCLQGASGNLDCLDPRFPLGSDVVMGQLVFSH